MYPQHTLFGGDTRKIFSFISFFPTATQAIEFSPYNMGNDGFIIMHGKTFYALKKIVRSYKHFDKDGLKPGKF